MTRNRCRITADSGPILWRNPMLTISEWLTLMKKWWRVSPGT